MHSGTGVKLPLLKLRAALGNEPTLVVDGVHALGVEPDPVDIDLCDVLVAGTHKWLGGPRGTGLIWSLKAWDQMRPVIPSFGIEPYVAWMEGGSVDPIDDEPVGALFTPGGYHSFEHRWALAEAFDVAPATRPREGRRAHPRPGQAPQGRLARCRTCGWSRRATPRSRPGIVCFEVDGMDPQTARRAPRGATGSGPP